MTEQVNPSLGRGAGPFETAGVFSYGGHGDSGWISPTDDPTDISVQSERIEESYLYAFDESHSSSSFTVDVEGGEAFIFGSWAAKDDVTGIYVGANNKETIYAGWDKNKGNNVIVGYSSDFASADKKIPLWDVYSDGTGVYRVDDRRNIGFTINAQKESRNVSSNYTTSGEGLIHVDTSGSSVTVTLSTEDADRGREIIVSDNGGAAGSNSITVGTEGTESINGSSTATIRNDWASKTFIYDGDEWVTSDDVNGMDFKSSGTNLWQEETFSAQITTTGEANISMSPDGFIEERSGSIANDGVPNITNRQTPPYEQVHMPGDSVNLHMWRMDMSNIAGGFELGNSAQGVTSDGSYTFVSTPEAKSGSGYLYKLDSSQNAVNGTTFPGGNPSGAAWDGTHILHVDTSAKYLYEFDQSLNVVGGSALPGSSPWGIGYDGSSYWSLDQNSQYIYELDSTYSVVGGTDTNAPYIQGIQYIGDRWLSGDLQASVIYELDNDFKIRDHYDVPGGNSDPHDVAWEGHYLFHTSHQEGYLYKHGNSYDYSAGVIN